MRITIYTPCDSKCIYRSGKYCGAVTSKLTLKAKNNEAPTCTGFKLSEKIQEYDTKLGRD